VRKALLVALVILLFNPPTASARAIVPKRCQFQGLHTAPWTDYEVEKTIGCFAYKFGISVETAKAVAWRESHFNEYAWNNYSDAAGVFQHLIRYWPERADEFPNWQRWMRIPDDCWCNPRLQAMVTALMVRYGSWSPWGY
jgi:hypothetical protein